MKTTQHKYGFSLVELSIVLVILGLLSGGILTGQSLIKASELRAISTEFQQYQTAVNTFQQKYFTLPGDMPNATQFWGRLSGYCTTQTGTFTTNGVCNGDGDSIIKSAAVGAGLEAESTMAWKMMSEADIITGQYSGLVGPIYDMHAIPGTNIPQSKFANGGWGFFSADVTDASHPLLWAYNYINSISFGGNNASLNSTLVLTPEEAWNVDKKMDDGKPAYGKVLSGN